MSLNPCCSGRWYRSNGIQKLQVIGSTVLILVVVEDGIGVLCVMCEINQNLIVLILVVVEDGIGAKVRTVSVEDRGS